MEPRILSQTFFEEAEEMITWGCPILDLVFAGGVPVGCITEIVSESGVGKTQLCLQLALNAQLPHDKRGLDGAALYMHTDSPFPERRLQQLATMNEDLGQNALQKVFVHTVDSVDDVLSMLCRLEKDSINRKVRLVVIDSVASLFRNRFDNTGGDLSRRQNLFFKLSAKLKWCAHNMRMTVIVTNQVVDAFSSNNNIRVGNDDSLMTSGRSISPALGLSWSNCVNTRIALVARLAKIHDEETHTSYEEKSRTMKVVFAPHLGNVACDFVITKEGVWGV